jgi:hypothetical protein
MVMITAWRGHEKKKIKNWITFNVIDERVFEEAFGWHHHFCCTVDGCPTICILGTLAS